MTTKITAESLRALSAIVNDNDNPSNWLADEELRELLPDLIKMAEELDQVKGANARLAWSQRARRDQGKLIDDLRIQTTAQAEEMAALRKVAKASFVLLKECWDDSVTIAHTLPLEEALDALPKEGS
jgi:hypothetical protein